MQLLTLKAKKNSDGSVTIFDLEGIQKAVYPSWNSSKPDYRHKYVMLNCYRYALEWIKP